jgi:hypothetical protein
LARVSILSVIWQRLLLFLLPFSLNYKRLYFVIIIIIILYTLGYNHNKPFFLFNNYKYLCTFWNVLSG